MIHFVTWKWQSRNYREKYTAQHVNVFASMLRRHYRAEHRLICVTDDPSNITECETFPLWPDHSHVMNPNGKHLPSCYRRLKIFDATTTAEMDIGDGEYVVSCDLDVVLVNPVDAMFRERGEDFRGWLGSGTYHPRVYNGTLFMFRAGKMQHLWSDFDPARSPQETHEAKYFGSDQGWLSYKLRGTAPGWGTQDGILSFSRDVRAMRQRQLPMGARIVSFNGKHKPWHPIARQHAPWIVEHWR